VPYYLGIDGGGTKTTCAVGDESQLLATATAGPSNIVRVGEAQARASLHQAVQQACSAACITAAQVARTCVGGSGAGRPELAELVRRILADVISTPVDVVGDMEVALEAAFDTGPGVIVIAGTGSIAYGRNAKGNTARAGGLGFAIGDEGSAHWIGREAVRAILRVHDRTQPPGEKIHAELAEAFCRAWAVSSPADLLHTANSTPPPDFAALFPAVTASQDELARQVLRNAGRELSQIAAVVIRRLFTRQDASVPVAVTGGVFRHSALVSEVFRAELRTLEIPVKLNPKIIEPVEGALSMARRSAAAARR